MKQKFINRVTSSGQFMHHTQYLFPLPIAAEKAKKRERSPSPETEELKRLKRMKEMQDLIVKEDEKYVAEPLDPKLFVWDDK